MNDPHPGHVFVVEDDALLLPAIVSVLRDEQLAVRTFCCAEDFLGNGIGPGPACLLLDVGLPGMGGLDLQRALSDMSERLPIIFLSGSSDIRTAVRAVKEGGFEFLTKPVCTQRLLTSVRSALARSRLACERAEELSALRHRADTLTPREREVMSLIITGLPNKRVASELGISEVTVKIHRCRVMRKMRADSLAQLVQWSARLFESSRSD